VTARVEPATASPRQPVRATTQQPAPRPAGPVDPVSSALDPLDSRTFPANVPTPADYAQRTPSSQRPGADGRGARRPLVVVVGFTSVSAGAVGDALRRSGLDYEFAFYEVVWNAALARDPEAVLCHVAPFGGPSDDRSDDRSDGFELIRAARAQGYRGAVVLFTPRLTPNERGAAREVGAGITNDTAQAVGLLRSALEPPPSAGPAAAYR
jgi:hypothetical protein